jgi:hypothetical protein
MTHSPEDKAKVTHTETTEVEQPVETTEAEQSTKDDGEPAQPDGKTDSSD